MTGTWTAIAAWAQLQFGLAPARLAQLVQTLVAIALYLMMRRVLKAFADRRTEDAARHYILTKMIDYVLGGLLIVALIGVWLGSVTGVATYIGVLSAGFAIALQDPVTNLAGWVFITLRKPFALGDRIQSGSHIGDVIDQGLFQFSLVEVTEQSTGRVLHIPNNWVFKHSTANYTQGFDFIWHEMPITVTFESDWQKTKVMLAQLIEPHAAAANSLALEQIANASKHFMVFFNNLEPIVWTSVVDQGVTLTLRFACPARQRRVIESAVWEDVLRAIAAADDIELAYPTTRFYDASREGLPASEHVK